MKKVEIFIDPLESIEEREKKIKFVCREIFEDWKNNDISLKIFTGGLSNILYRCSTIINGQEKYTLFRIFGNKTELLINRDEELAYVQKFQNIGGPLLFGTFSNGYLYEFFEGRALQPEDLVTTKYNERIAVALGQWHKLIEKLSGKQNELWTKFEKFISLVPDKFNDPEKQKIFEKFDWKAMKIQIADTKEKINRKK